MLTAAKRHGAFGLPLAPALIAAATLAPYSVLGVSYTTLTPVSAVTIRAG